MARQWWSSATVLVALIVFPLIGWTQGEPLDDPILERGRQTYMGHCASCHGEGGKGNGPLASSYDYTLNDLTTHTIHHDEATLFQMISQGMREMPGFATKLEFDEVIDLMDYLYYIEDSNRQVEARLASSQSSPTTSQESQPMSHSGSAASSDNMQDSFIDPTLTCPSRHPSGMDMDMSMMGMGSVNPMDAVGIGADLDGDNDPDEIVICLQILEITEEIAPGITMPFWVFAPDLGGMEPLSRLPGPTLRVEQGDRVKILVNNTHYFPHTLHMHGVLKPNNMDGVPDVTQFAIEPGESFSYEFLAQNPGTQWYHCHVQTPVHLMMGLYGLLIIEPNRPQNFVTPLVMTSHMPELSVANQEAGFSEEFMLVYQDIDPDLNANLNDQTLPLSALERKIHREYNMTERLPRYFVMNGRSFPFTLLDSQMRVRPNERVLLRVLNAGAKPVSLHLHGHKATVIARDGVPVPEAQRQPRDTFAITSAQRVDIEVNTTSDGVHAAGSGVWLIHDHTQEAVTTNGINPGGNIALMVYEDYVNVFGLPEVPGDLSKFFEPSYYQGKEPVFDGTAYADQGAAATNGAGQGGPVQNIMAALPLWAWVTVVLVVGLALGGAVTLAAMRKVRRKA